MDIINSRYYLLKNSDGSFFVQSLMFNDVIKKFAITAVFHYEVQFCFCFYDLKIRIFAETAYFIELNDVWVSHLF